jgi:hypothetical protein
MAFPGANFDSLLTKQSATTMLVQALVAQLQEKGLLTEIDLQRMRTRALGYAAFMKEHGGSGAQVGGSRIEQDLLILFEMLRHR